MDNTTYQLKHLNINFNDHTITSNGVGLSIDHKAVEVLQFLISQEGQTVSTESFMNQVWRDKPSAPEVVPAAVARLRKLFKMAGITDELIVTVHKVGYRFEPPNKETAETGHYTIRKSRINPKVEIGLIVLFGIMVISLLINWINQPKSSKPSTELTQLSSIKPKSNTEVTQIYILRHAEKVDDSADPDLSAAGIERAKYWKKVLQHTEFDQVFTTDFKRNIQTAELIADESSVKPELYHPMSFEVLKFLQLIQGQKVLIIGHSNTIPDMVNRLINDTRFPPMSHENYNILYVVTLDKNGAASTVKLHIEKPEKLMPE
ncbi:winged helix-turn-helix domain-containing protein [Marinicella sediminis]|uniref:Winged helix-turn-helix domain-containing protein n=1 Tax=Marinicella sediminis TaxID=1792834 RepID=A0ABV7JCK4_9GAMM|nr:winged helix-turn-helix domain-containing protein [Marinicella sediminis]